jgi:hypothetical protein
LPSGLIHRIAGPSMPAKIQKQNSTSGKNSGKEPVSWFGQGPEWPGLQKKGNAMKIVTLVASVAVAGFLSTGAFAASTTAAKTTTPATTTATTTTKKPAAKVSPEKTAISKQCSSLADAKGLHGKDREKFRAECKKNGGKMPQ